MYAAPADAWYGAPTIALVPAGDELTEPDSPNQSSAPPSPAKSSFCSVQVVAPCTNTYAAPDWALLFDGCCGAPTIATVPLTETDVPNRSPASASPAVRSGSCWFQVVPLCTNTYTAPPVPCLGAPTMAIPPLIDTEEPNSSP